MAGDPEKHARPRHFFLNEAHELATAGPDGGGRTPNFVPIDWVQKAATLRTSFDRAASYAVHSPDPSAKSHRFVLTAPAALTKISESKKAQATGGRVAFTPNFGGQQANLLTKLGLDLLAVDSGGNATVHVPVNRLPQLQAKLSDLANAGAREKVRWIHIGDFRKLDWTHRVDQSWLATLRQADVAEAQLRFHPVLPRAEVQKVLEALREALGTGESLVRVGRDFSGRYWCLARLRRGTIRTVAEQFPSLQSLHPRLSTPVAGSITRRGSSRPATRSRPVVDPSTLPTIGMFDTGVPDNHPQLSPFIRNSYRDPAMANELAVAGDHGSQVASALIFGHARFEGAPNADDLPPPTCRVFDMIGGWPRRLGEVPDEIWHRSIDTVVGTAADVRVFNLSLGGQRLETLRPKEREEKLAHLQDLDNQAFARDLILVYSAGNSRAGVTPSVEYPKHVEEEAWRLGFLASSFNGLVVGAHVDPVVNRGLVTEIGAPSPFTLVGPGQLDAPVPSFSAPGGDAKDDYTYAAGSGVWVFDAVGGLKDCAGTSYSAPLVAREAAFAFQELAKFCPDGRPFAATVRAWLTLEATRETFRGGLEKLARRTLGRGFPSSERIRRPTGERAVFIWQTMLESAGTTARVSVPVPSAWLARAKQPQLRVVVAWLTPVNAALTETWACRRVSAQIRASTDPAAPALRTGPGAVGAYPVSDRTFDISPDRLRDLGQTPPDDMWVLSVSYEELGPTPAGMEFTTQQRVGVALELKDVGETPESPQAAVQALAIPQMSRLSVLQTAIQVPVVVR